MLKERLLDATTGHLKTLDYERIANEIEAARLLDKSGNKEAAYSVIENLCKELPNCLAICKPLWL